MTGGVVSTFFLPPPTAPLSVAFDSNGNMWLANYSGSIERISVQGTLTEFDPPPDTFTTPTGIAVGPDGNVWFTDVAQHLIGRLTPTGTLTTFPGELGNIAAGPDGNLWFAHGYIGWITPLGKMSVFTLPGSFAWCITAGPDGNLWITEGERIGRLTPNGVLTEFPVPEGIWSDSTRAPTPRADSDEITAGPDGNLWFTQPGTHRIGRITPSGTITEFDLGDISPGSITVGADGNIWIMADNGSFFGTTGFHFVKFIGRLSPTGTLSRYISIPNTRGANQIAAGPDHNLWIIDPFNGEEPTIVRLDPAAVGEPDSTVQLASTTTTPAGMVSTLTAGEPLRPSIPIAAWENGQFPSDFARFDFHGGFVAIQNSYLVRQGPTNILRPDGTINLAALQLAPELFSGSGGNDYGVRIFQVKTSQGNVSPNTAFVIQVYQDLLKRQPDTVGLDGWLSELNQGTSRAKVVEQIEASAEYRTNAVENLYAALLGRAADPGGLQTWLGVLNAGGTVNQVETGILGSSEYFARRGAGTIFGFLASLYQDVLHRSLDLRGAATWGQFLGSPWGSSDVGRALVANAVLRSDEALQDKVRGLYQTFLHRPAEASGLGSFVVALKHGTSDEQTVESVVCSDEYFLRLQTT